MTSGRFEVFILVVILTNMLSMMMKHYRQSPEISHGLNILSPNKFQLHLVLFGANSFENKTFIFRSNKKMEFQNFILTLEVSFVYSSIRTILQYSSKSLNFVCWNILPENIICLDKTLLTQCSLIPYWQLKRDSCFRRTSCLETETGDRTVRFGFGSNQTLV